MYHLEIALFVLGGALVVAGDRRNGRNTLLSGAAILSAVASR